MRTRFFDKNKEEHICSSQNFTSINMSLRIPIFFPIFLVLLFQMHSALSSVEMMTGQKIREEILVDVTKPLATQGKEKTAEEIESENSSRPMFFGLRHIEQEGVGYNRGYTTGEGVIFLVPDQSTKLWPFIDLRYHFFNDGKQAINAGAGVRRSLGSSKWIGGVNGYYDYRQSRHGHYNQLGLGLELLGEAWDFRLNGYLPIGNKQTIIKHCAFNYPGGFFIIKDNVEAALAGINFEIGRVIYDTKIINIYGAIGAYYFGDGICSSRDAFGGKARFKLVFMDIAFIQGNISYDGLYGTRMQWEIGLRIPFGYKHKHTKASKRSFPKETFIQPIERFEIVVLDRSCRWKWNY